MALRNRNLRGTPLLLSRETPSSVLYADLRSYGGITNKDAARTLLSANITAGGKAPRDRIESRTYLSREVVHVSPKNVNPTIFADFYGSTQTLCSRVVSHVGGQDPYASVTRHYANDAAAKMCSVLASYGLDEQLYRNECARLMRVRLKSERDRHLLLFMLFCITGCLADIRNATVYVEDFAHQKLALDLATVSVDVDTPEVGSTVEDSALGLLRLVGNSAQPPILSLNPGGTMVGALAMGPNAVTNVGADVSRTHARIWRDGERWLVCGLKSTNGTTLTLGSTNEVISVEPPASKRTRKIDYPPQEIHEGDIICFGSNTRYLVLRVHATI